MAEKFVNQSGVTKIKDAYTKAIEDAVKDVIKNVTVQGQAAVVAEGTATVDLTSVLEAYAKQEDLEKITGSIKLEGSCQKADLTEKASTAKAGSIWIVTDDDNHFYLFVGAEAEESDNGWIDLGGHNEIKLNNYLEKTEAESTYVKIATGATQLKEQLDAAYLPKEGAAEALQAELDEVYCKVADGYVKTETADETYCKVADGYYKTTDLVAMSDEEINQALGVTE